MTWHGHDNQGNMDMDRHGRPPAPRPQPSVNTAPLWRVAILTGIFAVFAALFQPPLTPMVLSSLFTIAAMLAAFMALVSGERLLLDDLNRWDEAALFLLASIATRWLVDQAAIERLMAQGAGA